MKKTLKNTMLSLTMCSLVGCASIVSKSQYPVTISSYPQEAEISVMSNGNTIYKGKTPAHLVLEAGSGYFKKAKYVVRLAQKGYETQVFQIEPSVDGWYAVGNLGFGFLVGWLIVDPITGAMYKLEDSYTFTLSPKEKNITLVTLNDIPKEWHSHLKPLEHK